MAENSLTYVLFYVLVVVVGLAYARVVAEWRRQSRDGHLPPFAVTLGVGLAVVFFTLQRGIIEGFFLTVILMLLGLPQVVMWQSDWMRERQDKDDELPLP